MKTNDDKKREEPGISRRALLLGGVAALAGVTSTLLFDMSTGLSRQDWRKIYNDPKYDDDFKRAFALLVQQKIFKESMGQIFTGAPVPSGDTQALLSLSLKAQKEMTLVLLAIAKRDVLDISWLSLPESMRRLQNEIGTSEAEAIITLVGISNMLGIPVSKGPLKLVTDSKNDVALEAYLKNAIIIIEKDDHDDNLTRYRNALKTGDHFFINCCSLALFFDNLQKGRHAKHPELYSDAPVNLKNILQPVKSAAREKGS